MSDPQPVQRVTRRECDALVAEHVMGWPIFDGSAYVEGTRPCPHGWRRRFGEWDGDMFDGERNFKFRPTESWADAGPVAERFEGMELEAVYSILDPTVPTTRRVTFDLGGASVSATAATAPLAICLAALAANGIYVEVTD